MGQFGPSQHDHWLLRKEIIRSQLSAVSDHCTGGVPADWLGNDVIRANSSTCLRGACLYGDSPYEDSPSSTGSKNVCRSSCEVAVIQNWKISTHFCETEISNVLKSVKVVSKYFCWARDTVKPRDAFFQLLVVNVPEHQRMKERKSNEGRDEIDKRNEKTEGNRMKGWTKIKK